MEMIERMAKVGARASIRRPRTAARAWEMWRKWARWGVLDFRAQMKPQPIVIAAAFDPDGWKRVSNDMIAEAGVERAAALAGSPRRSSRTARIKGVICETKAGRQAILGDVVIDATGDLDVAAAAGAPFIDGAYIVTTVFRLGGVDTEAAERFAVRGAGGLRQARPPGQAHHGRLVGSLVAEDAAARRRLVQLPAHDRL